MSPKYSVAPPAQPAHDDSDRSRRPGQHVPAVDAAREQARRAVQTSMDTRQ